MKPRSSIWSTSSSTRNSTAPRCATRASRWSISRPGVATRTSRPCCSARICAPCGTPPNTTATLSAKLVRNVAEALRDLAREFAGRAEHQHAGAALRRRTPVGRELVKDRQREGRGLAGAGLGDADQIAALHQRRDRLGLNRRRARVAELDKRGGEGRGQAEPMKIIQAEVFLTPHRRAARVWRLEGLWEGNAPRVRASNAKTRASGRRTCESFTRPARNRPHQCGVAACGLP